MKILDKIMRLFGYENIENIKIYPSFEACPPNFDKMWTRRLYYNCTKEFRVPIVVDAGNHLEDGYTSYLIAKENNIKYVKVVRV